MIVKHYLSELDFSVDETRALLEEAMAFKSARKNGQFSKELVGKHVGLYFEKPSVRTRTSFTVGVHEMGGHVVELGSSNTKVGKGEHEEDFARVLSGYVHALVARVFQQDKLVRMAESSTIPVINALSDERHPCQALADVLTILERKQRIEDLKVVFIGEGNNVAASTGLLAAALGADVVVASPEGYGLPQEVLDQAKALAGEMQQVVDPEKAVRGADVLITDTWISMGQEAEQAARRTIFADYRITEETLTKAPSALVLHCLPAVRNEEITKEVMYSPASGIWDEAENRLHVQKALLARLLA